jgi:sterol desaturase/sphingolipid hydroxylase (fatty acid hydroxylase superfamily)
LVRDFNVGTLYSIFGMLFLFAGGVFGAWHWIESIWHNTPATSGTVMLSALPIMVGIQFLVAFLHYDVSSVPTEPLSRLLGRIDDPDFLTVSPAVKENDA